MELKELKGFVLISEDDWKFVELEHMVFGANGLNLDASEFTLDKFFVAKKGLKLFVDEEVDFKSFVSCIWAALLRKGLRFKVGTNFFEISF